jgi:AcrR family transcriptional regulator
VPQVETAVRRRRFVTAARAALARDGVAGTSLRAVAAEAGVPLATMQYAFPTKEQLLRAVIEDVTDEIAQVLKDSARSDRGLEYAIRDGLRTFWARLVTDHHGLQLMQYELTTHSVRAYGQQGLARRQYERYAAVVAEWCELAANQAGETSAVPFDQLARLAVASIDGLILQHICDPDEARSARDLEMTVDMLVAASGVRTSRRQVVPER